jgi:BlaI family penicillinase repressor
MDLKPTESELEILQVIWKKGQCSVRDVHEELAKRIKIRAIPLLLN